MRIEVSARVREAACPRCGRVSGRVHSRYQRRLSDLAIAGREALLHLRVRRFFCENSECTSKTFAEPFPDLAGRYARSTLPLRDAQRALGLALGGRPGARLAGALAVPASRTTLLRLVRATPVPEPGAVRVVGVDDFALRRGHNYATLLVDMGTHRPIDVLPDRTAESFAAWLRAHPGTEVICRDRASAYAEGARLGAPQAIQVADRWHLLHNLTDAVDRVVRAHRTCRNQPARPDEGRLPTIPADARPAQADQPEGRRVANTRRRHAEVQALVEGGMALKAIGRTLNLDVKTVRRYARARTPEELLTRSPSRGTQLDEHLAFLAERWRQGCDNAARLTGELRERGYRGSERSVRRLLQGWRIAATAPDAATTAGKPATPRQITGWIMRPADTLTEDDRAALAQVLDCCDTLRRVHQLVAEFAGITRERRGHQIDSWIAQAQASAIAPLRGFADGLVKDYDAVRAGLTLHWSSGAVEGNVTRVKALKRQMYGRANFDLLRQRVLLSV